MAGKKNIKINISLILTGYNEGDELLDNLETVYKILNSTVYKWEIILWDDCSSDNTPTTFLNFAKGKRNVSFYQNKINMGRGATVKRAMRKAKGKYIGYIDTDLELSPIYIPEFIRKMEEGADVVIARRIYVIGFSNLIRAILSRGYVHLARRLLFLDLDDTEAGFKFFRKKKISSVIKKVKDDRWFFDTEIVTRSYWDGLKIIEVPVVYIYNPQKASSVNIISDSILYFKRLMKFRKELPR